MPVTAKSITQEEFILALQERQMGAKDGAQALFYRMHKEMSPQLIDLVQEVRKSGVNKDQIANNLASLVEAYSRFVSSSIEGMALVITQKPNSMEHIELAKLIFEGVQLFFEDYIENHQKSVKSDGTKKPDAPKTP